MRLSFRECRRGRTNPNARDLHPPRTEHRQCRHPLSRSCAAGADRSGLAAEQGSGRELDRDAQSDRHLTLPPQPSSGFQTCRSTSGRSRSSPTSNPADGMEPAAPNGCPTLSVTGLKPIQSSATARVRRAFKPYSNGPKLLWTASYFTRPLLWSTSSATASLSRPCVRWWSIPILATGRRCGSSGGREGVWQRFRTKWATCP